MEHELVKSYNADGYSSIVSQVIETLSPNLIIAGHTYQTRDFMPRVSAKLRLPFVPDIVSVDDNKYIKQVLNAKLNAEISLSMNQFILSFQSAAFSEEDLKMNFGNKIGVLMNFKNKSKDDNELLFKIKDMKQERTTGARCDQFSKTQKGVNHGGSQSP